MCPSVSCESSVVDTFIILPNSERMPKKVPVFTTQNGFVPGSIRAPAPYQTRAADVLCGQHGDFFGSDGFAYFGILIMSLDKKRLLAEPRIFFCPRYPEIGKAADSKRNF
jgi:hypothetical protein